MNTIPFWNELHRVQATFRAAGPGRREPAIAALQAQLERNSQTLVPSLLYPSLLHCLRHYCDAILPSLDITLEDRQCVADDFAITLNRLAHQQQSVALVERRLRHFFRQFKSGGYASLHVTIVALWEIVEIPHAIPPSPTLSSTMAQQFRAFQNAPFTTDRLVPFFETLLTTLFTASHHRFFAPMQSVFWHQLHEWLHMKAILVNPSTKQTRLVRLDVQIDVMHAGLDELTFNNCVDDALYHSCWTALRVARGYLEQHIPNAIPKQSALRVTCRFVNPFAQYTDRSVSLLLALTIIGRLLKLEIDPHTVVTGALDDAGQVQAVGYMAEKLQAVQQVSSVQQLLCPSGGGMLSSGHIHLEPVRTFEHAALAYYGDQLRRKLRQVSRRQVLRSAAALAMIPVGLLTFTNIFSNPVSEHDLKLLDTARNLYQQKSDYQNALVIFDSIVDRFREELSTDAIQLKAEVLGHLGRIHLQRHQQQEGFSAYQRALDLWKAVHDTERQADVSLYRGIAHADTAIINNDPRHSKQALSCYTQVSALLTSEMKTYTRLRGNVALWTGVLYHSIGEHERARRLVETASMCFQDAGALWNYQLSRQYLGSIFVRVERHDEAFDIFQHTMELPLLQNPLNQAKSLVGFCDLFLSSNQPKKGLDYARQAKALCDTHDLRLQRTQLEHVLARHQVSWSIL